MGKTEVKFFDLFSGIGGFHEAARTSKLKSIKLKGIGYCEIDQQAKQLYQGAHNVKNMFYVDDANQIKTKQNNNGVDLPPFDMLFAGFPCQSFSNVGGRKGFEDDRGQLFYKVIDTLEMYKPKYFVLENVQKLSTINGGEVLLEMRKALEGLGYDLHVWDLNAQDYGVPQNRRRIFFCGVSKGVIVYKENLKPKKINLNKALYPTVWHLLERENVDSKHYIPTKTRKTVLYKNKNWAGNVNIDNLIARPITATMSKWHRANQDNYFSDSFVYSSEPNSKSEYDIHTEPVRRITPLEGYRIQGFPDRFAQVATESGLSYSTQYRLIGNAVPVTMARRVIETLLNED